MRCKKAIFQFSGWEVVFVRTGDSPSMWSVLVIDRDTLLEYAFDASNSAPSQTMAASYLTAAKRARRMREVRGESKDPKWTRSLKSYSTPGGDQ